MGTYTRFSREEVERALPVGFALDPDAPGNELVYRWPRAGGWWIYCYSGLQKGEDVSRDVGEDAIRFTLVDAVSDKGVGKTTRVHRTGDVDSLTKRMSERSSSVPPQKAA